jgi:NitT/TauT family transport system ATP-binding protein
MNPPSAGLSVKNLSFSFGEKPLFRDLSLDLGGVSPVVILGPSGCGKTTLLKIFAGLPGPEPGGKTAPPSSFVFQEPRLLPWMNALDNVALPIKRQVEKAGDRAREYLELVSLGDKAASFPDQLSGGERQRVAIARAFAFPARVIFMDEPFQSLDIPLRLELMDIIARLCEKEGRFLIAVTHDPREAVYLGKRIIILGKPPAGIVFDESVNLSRPERAYGTEAYGRLEARLLSVLSGTL